MALGVIIMQMIEHSEKIGEKQEFHHAFLIIGYVWAKIYIWNTSLSKSDKGQLAMEVF